MRVLDTKTGQFVEIDPQDKHVKYAILSHTWALPPRHEQTYKELKKIQKRHLSSLKHPQDGPALTLSSLAQRPSDIQSSPFLDFNIPPSQSWSETPSASIWDDPELSPKIRHACRVARENGYRYIWIDSCCIDKSSSSELSEAINSMYLWYGRATVCYAFLADVFAEEDHRRQWSSFRESLWFTRGWTLQELIAPSHVMFLSRDWTFIGSKHSLADLVEDITGISYRALLHIESLDKFSVAQRLSWASRRETTRVEDGAYSLLGIFDIHMPTLYGEGERAFRRLQEEIMRRIPDQTLFAWEDIYLGSETLHQPSMTASVPPSFKCLTRTAYGTSLLANSHRAFKDGSGIKAISDNEVFSRLQPFHPPLPEYTSLPHGIRTQVPVIPLSQYIHAAATECPDEVPLSQWYLVILGCEHKKLPGCLLGRICYIPSSNSAVEFLHSGTVHIFPDPERGSAFVKLFPLSPPTVERCRNQSQIQLKTVYISHPDRAKVTREDIYTVDWPSIDLILGRETRDALRDQGYTAKLRPNPMAHRLTLSNDEHIITIDYLHTRAEKGELTIDARVQTSRRLSPDSARDSADQSDAVTVSGIHYSSLATKSVTCTLKAAGARTYTVTLGLDHGGFGYYFPRVEVRSETAAASSPSPVEPPQGRERRVSGTYTVFGTVAYRN